MEKEFVVLIGPSGVGKSLAIKVLMKKYPDLFAIPLSATTRPPRQREGGNEYKFVTDEEFDMFIANNELYEWSTYAGHRYGLLKSSVEQVSQSGKYPLRAMDYPGACSIENCIKVFVNRDMKEVLKCLLSRNISDTDKLTRIAQAVNEYDIMEHCDFVLNNDGPMEQCVESLIKYLKFHAGQNSSRKTIDSIFKSYWGDGSIIAAPCKIDICTREVFDIQSVDADPDGGLIEETVTIDEQECPVYRKDEMESNDDFWYD